MDLIEQRRSQLTDICRRYAVDRLELFGSAALGLDDASSDMDFIVRFASPKATGIARRFVDLADELEKLFRRQVDLLTDRPFRNPYFAKAVDETRRTVYERQR